MKRICADGLVLDSARESLVSSAGALLLTLTVESMVMSPVVAWMDESVTVTVAPAQDEAKEVIDRFPVDPTHFRFADPLVHPRLLLV